MLADLTLSPVRSGRIPGVIDFAAGWKDSAAPVRWRNPEQSEGPQAYWRRGRDSNPRYRFWPVQRFSKPPPSATRPPLRKGFSYERVDCLLPVGFVDAVL